MEGKESFISTKRKIIVPRITQLDAVVFDSEIHNLLTSQLLEISKYLKPGALNNVKPELNLLIHLLMYRYSILKTNSSFGQQLLGVKYRERLDRNTVLWFAILNYGFPYIKQRYEESFTSLASDTVKSVIDKVECFMKFYRILNLMLFLRSGVHPTPVDRVLELDYAPVNALNRNVGYSFMTRELLWHGFMELLMFTLPLINYQSLKRRLRNLFPWQQKLSGQQVVVCSVTTTCAVCQESPTLPCRISLFCTHLACYYCIKANITADEKFQCPSCGATNTAVEQLQFVKC